MQIWALTFAVSLGLNFTVFLAREWILKKTREWNRRLGVDIRPYFVSVRCDFDGEWSLSDATKRSLRRWYSCGTVIVVSLLVPSVLVLAAAFAEACKSAIVSFSSVTSVSSSSAQTSSAFFETAFAPQRLRFWKIVEFVAAIGISTGVHEYGHALAAATLGCPLLGWGVMLTGVVPAAFVEIPTDFADDLRRARQSLAILCAGVWHNLVLTVSAFVCAKTFVALLLWPLLATEVGVFVEKLAEGSPLAGTSGFRPNDQIIAVNDVPVRRIDDVRTILLANQVGICVPRGAENLSGASYASSADDCCPSNASSSSLCFRDEASASYHLACLPVRAAFDAASSRFCSLFSDCPGGREACWRPVLDDAAERLVQFAAFSRESDVPSSSLEREVYFVGEPADFFRSVSLRDETGGRYRVRGWVSQFFPSAVSILVLSLASVLEDFLVSVASVSLTLAYFNALPCSFTDGERIWSLLMRMRGWTRSRRGSKFFNCFVWSVNVLTVFVVVFTMGKTLLN